MNYNNYKKEDRVAALPVLLSAAVILVLGLGLLFCISKLDKGDIQKKPDALIYRDLVSKTDSTKVYKTYVFRIDTIRIDTVRLNSRFYSTIEEQTRLQHQTKY